MNWSATARNITIGALVGGVLGLLVGLLLVGVTDSIDNPFWAMSIGIAVGAGAFGTTTLGRRDPGKR